MNFDSLIAKNVEKHAYVLGARQYEKHLNKEEIIPMLLAAPFDEGTEACEEWWNGYMDCFFLYHGVTWEK